ncbi:PepSY domain-containing protein [Paracoccus marinaquae]|uniref:PepSY domain-containing protein n=1 Tax=Paracoccus marinaquae TaxID=2841926 RepID=A0ABS6AH36_9RHOB|nr:PepSY domain-containing protein [Paracoccus marinaquae]MBU3028990.1 PepSY domain-containing protein [Paracoccus marinaquae]
MKIKLPLIAALVMAAAPALAQSPEAQIRSQLRAQGFHSINIDRDDGRIEVSARRGGQRVELDYSARTGRLLDRDSWQVARGDWWGDDDDDHDRRGRRGSSFGRDDDDDDDDRGRGRGGRGFDRDDDDDDRGRRGGGRSAGRSDRDDDDGRGHGGGRGRGGDRDDDRDDDGDDD